MLMECSGEEANSVRTASGTERNRWLGASSETLENRGRRSGVKLTNCATFASSASRSKISSLKCKTASLDCPTVSEDGWRVMRQDPTEFYHVMRSVADTFRAPPP